MRVFVANFGRENYEWEECKRIPSVATMNDLVAQAYWKAGDREGYILNRMQGKTAAGLKPTRQVASRWYNLMTIVSTTENDVWIHRDGKFVWWTISSDQPAEYVRKQEPVGDKDDVEVCHKPCQAWSSRTLHNQELMWDSLHPKARDFLSTEATLQELSEDYAAYAVALIYGYDLSPWHSQALWMRKQEAASNKHSPVTVYDEKKKAAYREAAERMAETVRKTVAVSNGQKVMRTLKEKLFYFNDAAALEKAILALIESQEGRCALTELPLDFDERGGDRNFFCSLDRIRSDEHYQPGNLQIVCRFVNFWKGASPNEEFLRLIGEVRSVIPASASDKLPTELPEANGGPATS